MYLRLMRLCRDLKKEDGSYAFKTNYLYITGWLQCRMHITWNRTNWPYITEIMLY